MGLCSCLVEFNETREGCMAIVDDEKRKERPVFSDFDEVRSETAAGPYGQSNQQLVIGPYDWGHVAMWCRVDPFSQLPFVNNR